MYQSKCKQCGRKNSFSLISCRCGNYYCSKHINAELHSCSFSAERKKELIEKNKEQLMSAVRKEEIEWIQN